MGSRIPAVAAAVAMACVLVVWTLLPRHDAATDPDRYFHLAVARAMAEQGGVLDALPQMADDGRARTFPDKELGFHVLTALGWAAAGERGALGAGLLASFALCMVVFVAMGRRAGPWAALLLFVVVALLDARFSLRVVFLRPWVLAAVWFFVVVAALPARRYKLAGAASFAFALTYHALYLPLGALVAHVVVERARGRAVPRAAWAVVAGLVVGALVHPAFPANLVASFEQIVVALGGQGVDAADLASELRILTTKELLLGFAGELLVVLAGLAVLARRGLRGDDDGALPFFLVIAAGLWVLALVQPRAAELAVPATALLAAALWPLCSTRARVSAVVVVAALGVADTARLRAQDVDAWFVRPYFEAIEAIPADVRAAKVMNCEWSAGSFVFYARPDLTTMDALDPTILRAHDEDLYRARRAFVEGRVVDMASLARDVIGARYVLCKAAPAIERMELDPAFVRRFPLDGRTVDAAPFLYEIVDAARAPYVDRYGASFFPPLSLDDAARVMPQDAPPLQPAAQVVRVEPEARSTYLVLSAHPAAPRAAPDGAVCALVRPAPEEVARRAGSTWLGVGGGPSIKVFVDGAPLLRATEPSKHPTTLLTVAPLPAPLSPQSRVEVIVCGTSDLGVSLSFWRDEDVEAACANKPVEPLPQGPTLGWAFLGPRRFPCPAPCASSSSCAGLPAE